MVPEITYDVNVPSKCIQTCVHCHRKQKKINVHYSKTNALIVKLYVSIEI